MKELVQQKEIEEFKGIVERAQEYSKGIAIYSPETYAEALNEGKSIKVAIDAITARKEEITKPLNAALKSVRDLFKPIETAGEVALTTLKGKMLAYSREEARKAEEAKRKLAERVERGTMKPETAVRKIEDIKEPEKTVATETAKATTKTVQKWRVTDKSKIPLDFMEPDMVKIKAEFKAGRPVAGVEQYEEQELSIG